MERLTIRDKQGFRNTYIYIERQIKKERAYKRDNDKKGKDLQRKRELE